MAPEARSAAQLALAADAVPFAGPVPPVPKNGSAISDVRFVFLSVARLGDKARHFL